MPIEMKLWQKEGDALEPLNPGKLESEQQLEEWIAADASIISPDILLIGRQVQTRYGGYIDLLGMDEEGNLVIIELKKDKTPRDVIAQALDYASWVRNISVEKIESIALEYLKENLESAFTGKFGTELPEELNLSHKIIIVASHLDPTSERIVKYLSEAHDLDINVVFFSCFVDKEGETLIGRSWLMEPVAVEDRVEQKKGRRVRLTVEQFSEIARSNGIGDLFDYLYEKLLPLSAGKQSTKTTIRFTTYVEGGKKAFLSIHPKESSTQVGLKTDVRPERIARAFSVDFKKVKDALPGPGEIVEGFLYGELHYFRSIDDIDKFVNLFKNTGK
jgi:hypothetical protein